MKKPDLIIRTKEPESAELSKKIKNPSPFSFKIDKDSKQKQLSKTMDKSKNASKFTFGDSLESSKKVGMYYFTNLFSE